MDKSIHNSDYRALINLLRSKREEKGITQTQLAERLDIDQATLSKIETCERRIDIIEFRAICLAIGLPFIGFLEEAESIFEPTSVK